MTDPITPAEAATADAIDANLAAQAANPNSDLVGGVDRAPEAPPRDPMAIPHAHHVLPSSPAPLPAKVVTPSALLAEKIAAQPAGAKPVKRRYAYQRKRK